MVRTRHKLLILLDARKLSTPWVTGSNPVGIANNFNGMGALFSKNPCRVPY
jgi:hypothetical protein